MNAGMRVLMLLTPGVSFVRDWARAASHVADVVSVTTVRTDWLRRHTTTVDEGQLRIPRLRPTRMMYPVADAAAVHRLKARLGVLEQQHGPFDVVHTHFYSSASFMPALKRESGLPYVITEHSTRLTGRSARHKPLSKAGSRIARSVYSEAHRVIVPSEYLAKCIERLDLCAPSKIVVLGNPIDVENFRPGCDASGGALRIVAVGRLEEDKDPFLLLHAFSIALTKEHRLTL